MNLYGYVGGMPTRAVDPSGLEQVSASVAFRARYQEQVYMRRVNPVYDSLDQNRAFPFAKWELRGWYGCTGDDCKFRSILGLNNSDKGSNSFFQVAAIVYWDKWHLSVDITPGSVTIEDSEDGCHQTAYQLVVFSFNIHDQKPEYAVTIGASGNYKGVNWSAGTGQTFGGGKDLLLYKNVAVMYSINTKGQKLPLYQTTPRCS